MNHKKDPLIDDTQKHDLLRGSHTIVVPMNVQIEPRSLPSEPGREPTPCVAYPVPESWAQGVISEEPVDLINTGQWTWEKGEHVTPQALFARARRGGNVWRGGAQTAGLLEDFVRLADPDLYKSENAAYAASQVARFVKRWGPLWLCRTIAHATRGRRCYWHPRQAFVLGKRATACTWYPVEEVRAFLDEAQQAEAALKTITSLKKADQEGLSYAASETVRAAAAGNADPYALAPWKCLLKSRQVLMETMWSRLSIHGWHTTELLWLSDMPQPTMRQASPVGFLPAVWMEMAQILSGGKGLYECPSCYVFFTPKRHPRTGQRPFCDTCKQGNTGSSKLYQQRRRAAARARDSQ